MFENPETALRPQPLDRTSIFHPLKELFKADATGIARAIIEFAQSPETMANIVRTEVAMQLLAVLATWNEPTQLFPEIAADLLAIQAHDRQLDEAVNITRHYLISAIVRHLDVSDAAGIQWVVAAATESVDPGDAAGPDDGYFRLRFTIGCRIASELLAHLKDVPDGVAALMEPIIAWSDYCLAGYGSNAIARFGILARSATAQIVKKLVQSLGKLIEEDSDLMTEDSSSKQMEVFRTTVASLRILLSQEGTEADPEDIGALVEMMRTYRPDDFFEYFCQAVVSVIFFAIRNNLLDFAWTTLTTLINQWHLQDPPYIWGSDFATGLLNVLALIWTSPSFEHREFIMTVLARLLEVVASQATFMGSSADQMSSDWESADMIPMVTLACRAVQGLSMLGVPIGDNGVAALDYLGERIDEMREEDGQAKVLLKIEVDLTKLFIGYPFHNGNVTGIIETMLQTGLVVSKYHRRLATVALTKRAEDYQNLNEGFQQVINAMTQQPDQDVLQQLLQMDGGDVIEIPAPIDAFSVSGLE
jgi:hypothetical protein